MGNPYVRFDEGRERIGHWPTAFQPNLSCLLYVAPAKLALDVGASPTGRIRLFTTEHDLHSVAVRRGWQAEEEEQTGRNKSEPH